MANDNFDLPRPTDAVPSSTSAVINDDAKVLDYVVNSTGAVVTRTGKTLLTIDEAINRIDWALVGKFADGVTFTKSTDFALDGFNVQWIYVGSDPFPKVVAPATVPSAPDYQVINARDHSSLTNLDSGGHDVVYTRAFDSIAAMASHPSPVDGLKYLVVTQSTARLFLATASVTSIPIASGLYAQEIPLGLESRKSLDLHYIEQFLTGFQGRGQIDAEVDNLLTNQSIVGTFSKGASSVNVTTPSDFKIGGHITILHDNGKYWTYFINDIISSAVFLSPKLKYAVSNKTCERTWYNKAHPGKYYMRQLAQRIASSGEVEVSAPANRALFSQFDSNPNEAVDSLTVVNSASIAYFDASNTGSGGAGSSLRFNIGRTALVTINAAGDGARTQGFANYFAGLANLRVTLSCGNSDTSISVKIFDDSGIPIPIAQLDIPSSESLTTPTIYNIPCRLTGNGKRFFVEITATNAPTVPADLYIDQIDVFELKYSGNSLFDKNSTGKMVVLGDSWVAGDLGTSAEREPITQQLAIELPNMTIINAGVGGNTATDLITRFDTDVTAQSPDYVVINVGTNDCYSPSSGTFFPNAVNNFVLQINQLVSRCQSIGAKPILVGVPALAESDGAYTAYELNNRARLYAQYFYKRLGVNPQSKSVGVVSYNSTEGVPTGAVIESYATADGIVIKYADGTMIQTRKTTANTASASVSVAFPIAFAAGTVPSVSFALETLTSGNTNAAMASSFIRCADNINWIIYFNVAGTDTETFNFFAVGRWF